MAWRRESAITEDGGDVEEAAEEVEAVEFLSVIKARSRGSTVGALRMIGFFPLFSSRICLAT